MIAPQTFGPSFFRIRSDEERPVAFTDEAGTPFVRASKPDPAEQARQDAREAREAVERQRKDQLDREEREAAAKRAHAVEVMRLTLDHNVAVRGVVGWDPEAVGWLMGGAAALGASFAGLVALAIP